MMKKNDEKNDGKNDEQIMKKMNKKNDENEPLKILTASMSHFEIYDLRKKNLIKNKKHIELLKYGKWNTFFEKIILKNYSIWHPTLKVMAIMSTDNNWRTFPITIIIENTVSSSIFR